MPCELVGRSGLPSEVLLFVRVVLEVEGRPEAVSAFVDRLGLTGVEPVHESGHLTRCRADDAPLRRGRVLVAGDAAGRSKTARLTIQVRGE